MTVPIGFDKVDLDAALNGQSSALPNLYKAVLLHVLWATFHITCFIQLSGK
ncbi:MAG: hypothetical protein QME78_16485 [Thermodesulfobacteriota bacterium]|nr:hypothetical protein [Thermodesulfobacteriota bacterium]